MIKSGLHVIRTFFRQPLVHFLAAGALIFFAYSRFGGGGVGDADGREIVIDREDLLNFMQYRAQAFDRDSFAEQFDGQSSDERSRLVQDFVLEEALYRQALAMGLDQGDYDIRLRLVQKMHSLLQDIAIGEVERDEPSVDTVRDFFRDNIEDYRVDPVYTFAHVFFDSAARGDEQAHAQAAELHERLRADSPDEELASQGDRFRYLRVYRERGRDQVVNNFGADFAAWLDAQEAGTGQWSVPARSDWGWHLVLLQSRTDSYLPEFEAVEQQVLDDYRYMRVAEVLRGAIDELLAGYDVTVVVD